MSFEDVYPYAAIVLLGLGTVLTRAGFLMIGDYIPLPERVRSALRYAPIAGLTAIIVPVLLPWEAGSLPQFDLKLLAAVVSVFVFIRTRNAFMLIASGMMALWSFRWIVSLF
ncbi:AzlD domain-containing protein [Orrella sp. NBD-18]|uniref:AzlD domain-containing protein n=1 Tax=Sheuella amnicola TaxID=2707330 RepID=A0A6B2QYJ3_9BURK|nr:AzlD domain-containing protein [Sheuella amnicola]NDY83062.1 AzlD domain-containing protein [Sheuella amnicola]HBI82645.1 hypothetical protein [Alcaligenaceae bacterium]